MHPYNYPFISLFFFCTILLFSNSILAQEDQNRELPPRTEEEYEDIDKPDEDDSYDDSYDYNYRRHGFFISSEFKLGAVNNEIAIFTGGRIGVTFEKKITLGLAGYALLSDFNPDGLFFTEDFFVTGGYGGILFEPIMFPESPLYLTFPVVLGAGMVIYDDTRDGFTFIEELDLFWVAEPGISLEVNANNFLRFGLTASHRFTTDVGVFENENTPLNGWSGGIFVKFGRF